MDSTTIKGMVMGGVRHLVTTFGGVLVTAGYVDSNGLVALAGGAAVLAGIIDAIVEKKLHKA